MSEVSELPGCVLHQSVTQPAIDRLSRDTNSAHSMLREHGVLIDRLNLWREESTRRIAILESALEAQRAESRRTDQTLARLSDRVESGLDDLTKRMSTLESGISLLVAKIDRHLDDVMQEQVRATQTEATRQRQATERHERWMRRLASIVVTLGALVSVLMMFHSVFSGIPIVDAIKSFFTP